MNPAAITGSGGVRLSTYEWLPETAPPKALVAFAHGYSEHAGRHARLARELVGRRYAVVALDHRGHGRSGGPRAACEHFDTLTDDFALLVHRARGRFEDLPCFVLGHSMGSLVALRYVLSIDAEDIAGLVVSGVALKPGREVPGALRPVARGLIRFVARIKPDLPIIPPRLSRLCTNPEVVRAFKVDPLCYSGPVRAGLADEVLTAANDTIARLDGLTCPLLALHGELDIMTDPEGAVLLVQRAAAADKTLHLFDGLQHEIFNEKATPNVFATLASWLDERTEHAAIGAVAAACKPPRSSSSCRRKPEEKASPARRDTRHLIERLGGKRPTHEGRYAPKSGTWTNWNGEYSFEGDYHVPEDLSQLQDLVRTILDAHDPDTSQARLMRVVGGGHSFNDSPAGRHLISLDRLNAVSRLSRHEREEVLKAILLSRRSILGLDDERCPLVRAQAGVRLHALTRQLAKIGLALPVQGSTDAQSLGGLIATDVHGTGFLHGFLSEQLVELKILEKDGQIHAYHPADEGFHHAIGGLGETGILVEAVIVAEPAFDLTKAAFYVPRRQAEEDMTRWMAEPEKAPYHHISLYYAGGVDPRMMKTVRMNTWTRCPDGSRKSRLAAAKIALGEAADMLASTYHPRIAQDLAARDPRDPALRLAEALSPPARAPAHEAFGRQLFFAHDEIEHAIPLESYRACLEEVLAFIYERNFDSIIEVRFTPGGKSQATIAPGAGEDAKAYIELATSLALKERIPEVYPDVEKLFLKHGGQPHLGKKTYLSPARFGELNDKYRARLAAFLHYRDQKGGPFSSAFAERLLGPVGAPRASLVPPSPSGHAV